jgi:O-antigen ligase
VKLRERNRIRFAPLEISPTVLEVGLIVCAAIIYGAMIVKSGTFAVALTLGLLLFFVLSKSPVKTFLFLLFVIPFSMTTFMSEPVIDLPGMRPFLLLGAMAGVIVVLNHQKRHQMPRLGFAVLFVVVFFFGLSAVRGLDHLDTISFEGAEQYSTSGYFLSLFFKPLVYLMPLFLVLTFFRNEADIQLAFDGIVITILIFSTYFLLYYTFEVKDKGNIDLAWEYAGDALGLHKGEASAFYTVGFPVLLARYFTRKNILSLLAILLSLPAVGFLYSRTAYVTVFLSLPLYLFFSKKVRLFPILVLLGILAGVLLTDTIQERITRGVAEESVDLISAGRVNQQWIPLLEEYLADPEKLLFGQGLYSVYSTEAYRRGVFPGASHPHNMYLELLLNTGLIGFFLVLLVYGVVLKKIYDHLKSMPQGPMREYLCGSLVSMICFLAGGMTRGSFFPQIENAYFWAIAALAIVIMRLSPVSGPGDIPQQEEAESRAMA